MAVGADWLIQMWYPPKTRTDQIDRALEERRRGLTFEGGRDQFLIEASACIYQVASRQLVPPAVLRDWLWIASQYRIHAPVRNAPARIAAAALHYLKESLADREIAGGPLKANLNWVVASTVLALRTELGPDSYQVFLGDGEGAAAECAFNNYCQEDFSFERLSESVMPYLSRFNEISSESYLPGMADMISRLLSIADPSNLKSSDQMRRIAGGALTYLIKQSDIVPDTLGYVGLVDDIHIISKAIQEIEKRGTWEPIFGFMETRWPYLTQLAFPEPDATVRLTPYMRTVLGVALNSINMETDGCIVVPEPGPLALLAAFAAAIEGISETIENQVFTESPIRPGDHVILEGAALPVKAKYVGTLRYDGSATHYIELRKNLRVSIGSQIPPVMRKATNQHRQLSHNDEFNEWRRTYSPHPLVHAVGGWTNLDLVEPRTLVLMRKNRLDRYVNEICPMGRSIPQLIGIRYVTNTGSEIEMKGTDSGNALVLACSDPLTAAEIVKSETAQFRPRTVLVDSAELAAPFVDLVDTYRNGHSPNMVVIAGQHESESLRHARMANLESWFLRQEDVELVHPSKPPAKGGGRMTLYQRRQWTQSQARSNICEIRCDAVEKLNALVEKVRLASRSSGNPQLPLIEVAAGQALRSLLRIPFQANRAERDEQLRVLQALVMACSIAEDYSPEARDLHECVELLIRTGIPSGIRAQALTEVMRASRTKVHVLCQSDRQAAALAREGGSDMRLENVEWISGDQLRDVGPVEHLVVPGWHERGLMRELRNAGYAEQIDYLFLPFEIEWDRRSRRAAVRWRDRLSARTRDSLERFSRNVGIRPEAREILVESFPRAEVSGGIDQDETEEPETLTEWLDTQAIDVVRRRASGTAVGSRRVRARLVIFDEPGTYILLPPQGNVISVSRVLETGELRGGVSADAPAESDAESLISCPVSDVRQGDLLAFPIDSKSDLLDLLASRFLRDGDRVRRLARLWRDALRECASSMNLTVGKLRDRLENAGLKRTHLTVSNWLGDSPIIAPASWEIALPAIATATQNSMLSKEIDAVIGSINLLYRARRRAASTLVEQLARAGMSLEGGIVSVAVEESEFRFRVLRVLSVDPPSLFDADEVGVLHSIAQRELEFGPHVDAQ